MKVVSMCFSVVVLFWTEDSFGKAAYATKDSMIQHAEIIAVVEIERVDQAQVKGRHWTYSEAAQARVLQTLKGSLSGTVTLYGGEDFICAQVHYRPGKCLVFLEQEGDLITGVNWQVGVRKITGDTVEWFKEGTRNVLERTPAPLGEVVTEIRGKVAAGKGQ